MNEPKQATQVTLVDQIPPPEQIVRRLGETATERRVLRALLRVAKLKKESDKATAPDAHSREGASGV